LGYNKFFPGYILSKNGYEAQTAISITLVWGGGFMFLGPVGGRGDHSWLEGRIGVLVADEGVLTTEIPEGPSFGILSW